MSTLDISRFPVSPGVYIMKDAQGNILYIGKAVNLRSRVRSYFNNDHVDRPYIPVMLKNLDHIEWIVTNTESESLILEANLVRQHKPPYNIELRDDKHFPYLKVTLQEPFPRILVTRRVQNDGARYFGPYTEVRAMRRLLGYAKKIFRLRDCNKKLPLKKPVRPCINYAMKRCSGACANKITREAYRQSVDQCVQFLAGRRNELVSELKEKMLLASHQLQFEQAALYRDQIRLIEDASRLQKVDLIKIDTDCDVFGVYEGGKRVCITILHFREGLLLSKQPFILPADKWFCSEKNRELILLQFYQERKKEIPDELIISETFSMDHENAARMLETYQEKKVRLVCPQRGTKLQLVRLAEKNARLYMTEKIPREPAAELAQLARACSLPHLPLKIEAFDISNMGANFAVAGMVCFVNATPRKSEYRRFKIKTVEGQNDFAMMLEAVSRRLNRLAAENKEFPDLLLIDGGKGQLHAAMQALNQFDKPPMILSLAKREEILFSPYVAGPVRLDPHDGARKLVQRVRDEVHRWAITYHRTIRGKQFKKSHLENLPGVGPATARLLLKKFGSLKALKNASIEEIRLVQGFSQKRAEVLKENLEQMREK